MSVHRFCKKWSLGFAVTMSLAIVATAADPLSLRFQRKLETAETNYQVALRKADSNRMFAIQGARNDRIRALKVILNEATKMEDEAAITRLTNLISTAEASGGTRAKPKDMVKFQDHEYAHIPIGKTWHLAQKYCEEMGGHLVIINDEAEKTFITEMCRKANVSIWIGATDEELEGTWKWVDGTAASFPSPHVSKGPNDFENSMALDLTLGDYNDIGAGRATFICEWP